MCEPLKRSISGPHWPAWSPECKPHWFPKSDIFGSCISLVQFLKVVPDVGHKPLTLQREAVDPWYPSLFYVVMSWVRFLVRMCQVSASHTHLDVHLLSLIQGGSCLASFHFLFSGNCFISSCRFGISMKAFEFSVFLWNHLRPETSFLNCELFRNLLLINLECRFIH